MKLAIGAAAMALVLGGFAFAAGIDGGGDDQFRTPSSTNSTTGTTTTGTTTTGTTTTGTTTTDDRRADDNGRGFREPGEDVRGPCDEAEHANDPRCTGAAAVDNGVRGDVREPGEDVRGPCDEAEHANDPRCTGAAVQEDHRGRGRDDEHPGDDHRGRSGRGGGDDDHGEDDRGDDDSGRSGSNSGRG